MNYKNGISKDTEGYILVYFKGHPMARGNGYVPLHRLIVSSFLGRNLTREEIVHHKNGDKTDNRIENLELTTKSQHALIHNSTREYRHKTNAKIIRKLYLQGYSGRSIASMLNMGKTTVLNCIKKLGISRSNMSLRDEEGKFISRKEVC